MFVLGAAFLVPAQASATQDQPTVRSLAMACMAPDYSVQKTHCYGYIAGVIDVLNSYSVNGPKGKPIQHVCFPRGITARMGAAAFVTWYVSHENYGGELVVQGVIKSFQYSFPCSSNG